MVTLTIIVGFFITFFLTMALHPLTFNFPMKLCQNLTLTKFTLHLIFSQICLFLSHYFVYLDAVVYLKTILCLFGKGFHSLHLIPHFF